MAISMMACRATIVGLEALTTRDQYGADQSPGRYPGLKSSCLKPVTKRLGCLKSTVGLRRMQLSSSQFGRKAFSVSSRWHGAKECTVFGPRSNSLPSTGRGLGLENGRFSSSKAASGVSDVVDDELHLQTDGGHIFNFLQRIASLRALPVLVLTLGVVLSLRPGHALADVATEALGPQGKGLLASAWAGLVAGCLHTLTGPDHLAALAPLCIGRSRVQSAAVGALWGCGHDAGQIIFGLIFLVLKDKLHIELIRTWASRIVGLTLITIGGVGIYESQEHVAVLAEEAGPHDVGGGKQEVRIKNDSKHATTFATGVVYGLQPDALLMILPALALPSRITGAAFLVMFLLGTVLAMGSYTLFISSCSHALQKRLPGITKNLTVGSSIIAIALGLGLVASELFGLNVF